jgi:glycosyltransferase involved in cell wall biosynthesis
LAEPLRVLHVITDRDRRGAQVFASDLAHGLEALGVRNEVVALAPGEHGDLLPIECLGPSRRSWRTIRALRRRAREFDVVVAHGSATLLVSAVGLWGSRVPFVYRQISDPLHWAASLPRRVRVGLFLRQAAGIVSLSPSVAEVVSAHYRLPLSKITVLPNAVPAGPFAPPSEVERATARAKLNLQPDSTVALYVGALAPEKGVDMAIEAAGAIRGLQLVVVGSGPERDRLEELATRVAPGRVHFTGPLDKPVIAMHASDFIVLASKGGDSMPAVLIEAGLCGLAAVSTPVGAISDVVIDGHSGFVVPIDDQARLTAAVKLLADDTQLHRDFGAAARERCLSRFTIEATATGWLDLLSWVGQPADTARVTAQPPNQA